MPVNDFTPDAHPASDFTPDSGNALAGSVFEPPGSKLKRLGKAAGKFAAGAALPYAAGAIAGPEAGIATRVGLQAVAGAAAPYAEYGISKIMGENPQVPSLGQAARSAAFAAGITGAGEVLGAFVPKGAGSEVAGQIRSLPSEAQTAANVKTAVKNRAFWKSLGVPEDQIDAAIKSPEAEREVTEALAAGKSYKGAFQNVIDSERASFKSRYDTLLGPAKDLKISAVPIGQQFEAAAQAGGEHEITPAFRSFLQRKGLELTKAGDVSGPSVGGVPWKNLPEKLKDQLRSQGKVQGIRTPSEEYGVQDVRDLRTELRENLPGGATNLDKKVYQELTQQLNDEETAMLKRGGATAEQIGGLKALDDEYGVFQQTLKSLDPRSEKFGADVGKVLWTNATRNPSDALNFIRMAQAADKVSPGTMDQLRSSFLQNAIAETRAAAQGRPIVELGAIQKLQQQWGGDKQLRGVMKAMNLDALGDPTTLSKIIGALSKPDQIAADAARGQNPFRVPGWLLHIGNAYATYAIITGSPLGPWTDMRKNPVRFAAGMATLMATSAVAGRIYSYGSQKVQRAYTNFLLEPNQQTLRNVSTLIASGAVGIEGMPTAESVAERQFTPETRASAP